ncbi:type II toxin-antitoxin system MqsR family toxin [Mesorhizobium sp. B2-4-12]|uniref:type II toxin-antitoxin system MqsR family toxin n=1 Tax=Mesorhizobium sp. B2-4-12 TaxID=2589937 RepID=UPI00112AB55C|nr:type II toxin-antitoxin system MqsR family toxin [Mesorhizobium sp. B2-4-12]TPK99692.1 type II toxin-antitoxin system MqsR family toxin [Mesorhizobium sp. B2-4-12]
MEKRRPAYDLDVIKTTFGSVDTVAITTSALRHWPWFRSRGRGRGDRRRKMFVKSMTTFADHRVWQDVYHVPPRDLILYVKFQADVVTEFTIMSFKEK